MNHTAPLHDALYPVADAAPLLGMGVHELFKWLRDHNYITRTANGTLPQHKYIRAGYFRMKQGVHQQGRVRVYHASTLITTRGMQWLQTQLNPEATLCPQNTTASATH